MLHLGVPMNNINCISRENELMIIINNSAHNHIFCSTQAYILSFQQENSFDCTIQNLSNSDLTISNIGKFSSQLLDLHIDTIDTINNTCIVYWEDQLTLEVGEVFTPDFFGEGSR